MIPKDIFDFLTELKANNNREWFETNKPRYQVVRENFQVFPASLVGAGGSDIKFLSNKFFQKFVSTNVRNTASDLAVKSAIFGARFNFIGNGEYLEITYSIKRS